MVRWSLVVVALVGSLATNRVALAGEVPPPAGANITFDTGSPLPGATHIAGSGTYAVPNGWSLSDVRLRIYSVTADGKRGNFLREAIAASPSNGVWTVAVTGLQPNTEYWVVAVMKVSKNFSLDYARVEADGGKKKTLAAGGGGME